jgi:hypothetical protein
VVGPVHNGAVASTVIRARAQVVATGILAAILVVFAAVAPVTAPVVRRTWYLVALVALLGALGLVGVWAAARAGVTVSASGIRVRAFGPGRTIPVARVGRITCEEVGRAGGGAVYAPCIEILSDDGTRGGQYDVRVLGSYRRSVAEARTDAIDRALDRPPRDG